MNHTENLLNKDCYDELSCALDSEANLFTIRRLLSTGSFKITKGLMSKILARKDPSLVLLSLQKGISPDPDSLSFAWEFGVSTTHVIKLLVEAGAQPNTEDLNQALFRGEINIVRFLHQKGVKFDTHSLQSALQSRLMMRPHMVELALELVPTTIVKESKFPTSFSLFTVDNGVNYLESFLVHGLNPNGENLLYELIQYKSQVDMKILIKLIDLLLKFGADPNLIVPERELKPTCLGWILEDQYSQVVQILLKSGANPNLGKQKSYLAQALKSQAYFVVQLLIEHGAQLLPSEQISVPKKLAKNGRIRALELLNSKIQE